MIKRESDVPVFEVESYIGTPMAEFQSDAPRPPRTARMVVAVDMGSGPGGGDYRTYLLSSDQSRSCWILWAKSADYDTGRPVYCRMGSGEPYRGITAKDAAEYLLAITWADEIAEGWLGQVLVTEPGLLTAEDVARIERRAHGGG